MKIVEVTDYTSHHVSILDRKMYKFKTPINVKIVMKCAQNRRCISLMCEQSLCKEYEKIKLF